MNNKKALLLTTAPLAVILFLTIGLRFAMPREEAEAETRLLAAQDMARRENDATLEERRRTGRRLRPAPFRYERAGPGARRGIKTAIRGQIEAIARRDFEKALSFATPSYRDQWTIRDFESTIERGFQSLLKAQEVNFGNVFVVNSDTGQADVIVSDNTESPPKDTRYRYLMQRDRADESGATWHVSAAMLASDSPAIVPPAAGGNTPPPNPADERGSTAR